MNTNKFERADVVILEDRFEHSESHTRPFLIIGSTSPFAHNQVTVVPFTTQAYPGAIRIRESDWEQGGIPRSPSYVNVWSILTRKRDEILHGSGTTTEEFANRVSSKISRYLSDEVESEFECDTNVSPL